MLLGKFKEEIRDKEGKTLLMRAAKSGFRELVELFVRAKYNVNVQDNDGKTALFHALDSLSDNADVVECLVNNGANLSSNTSTKQSLISYLIERKGMKS